MTPCVARGIRGFGSAPASCSRLWRDGQDAWLISIVNLTEVLVAAGAGAPLPRKRGLPSQAVRSSALRVNRDQRFCSPGGEAGMRGADHRADVGRPFQAWREPPPRRLLPSAKAGCTVLYFRSATTAAGDRRAERLPWTSASRDARPASGVGSRSAHIALPDLGGRRYDDPEFAAPPPTDSDYGALLPAPRYGLTHTTQKKPLAPKPVSPG
jgi:hypothetical protein